jgi:GTPase
VQHTVFERPDGSGRRLTLVDLAGHEKYLRTTIYGFNR